MDPGYSLAVAGITGFFIHMALSIAFAMIFASMASPAATESTLALGGILFGTMLWLVNFYVIAPLAGWTWFPEQVLRPGS